ncbi:unnamed protein product, partial [Symbiodinium sp. CCMP2592]
MPQPFISAQCGLYHCVCVLDPQDQCGAPEQMNPAAAEPLVDALPSDTLAKPKPAMAAQDMAPIMEDDEAVEAETEESAHAGLLQTGGSSSSAAPPRPAAPVPRLPGRV